MHVLIKLTEKIYLKIYLSKIQTILYNICVEVKCRMFAQKCRKLTIHVKKAPFSETLTPGVKTAEELLVCLRDLGVEGGQDEIRPIRHALLSRPKQGCSPPPIDLIICRNS